MAQMRQALPSAETLALYTERLYEWELSDLMPVIDGIALRSRMRGETAFPPLADIIDGLKARTARSQSDSKSRGVREQQEQAFWEHVDYLKQRDGITEQEVLDQIKSPGFTGRRARDSEKMLG